jgi:hypothetical protein
MNRLTDALHYGEHVVELALKAVLGRIAAGPTTTPVHGVDGEVAGKPGRDEVPCRVVRGAP